MSNIAMYEGDCLSIMKTLPKESIDMVLCDLPYGTTVHKWDCIIPFELLWESYKRIIKDTGVIVLFATEPFTSGLIWSNIEMYRYSWIWKKESPNGFLNANFAPLKITEDICVFSKATVGSLSKNPIPYHPPCLIEKHQIKRNNPKSTYREINGYHSKNNKLNSDKTYETKFTNYPNNILCYPRDKEKYHPAQKPVALCEFLIKTYTDEGDTVLDNCMGSGSTGVAAINCKRDFIGIELNHFEIAKNRIFTAKMS